MEILRFKISQKKLQHGNEAQNKIPLIYGHDRFMRSLDSKKEENICIFSLGVVRSKNL